MRNPWSRGYPVKGLLLLAAAAAGGAWWWQVRRDSRDAFPGVEVLDIEAYIDRPAALRGNRYTVRGTVDKTLANAATGDRLIMVIAGDGQEKGQPLSMRVPASMTTRMQTGRQFIFHVTVGEAGFLVVQDVAET